MTGTPTPEQIRDAREKGHAAVKEFDLAPGAATATRAIDALYIYRALMRKPTPKTPEEKKAFSEAWDARYIASQEKK